MQRAFQIVRMAIPLALSIFVNLSEAQVGPRSDEIPPQPAVSAGFESTNFQDNPSDSQIVKPAIDALLLSASSQFQASQPSAVTNSVASDLRSQTDSIPIGLPASATPSSALVGSPKSDDESAFAKGGYVQTIVALLGVILLILGLGQVYKHLARSQGGLIGQLGAGGSAPSGIIEVIGRYPISKGMTLVVLKFDRRVLLLSHASSTKGKGGQLGSMQVLSELTDPEDIASILLKSRSASGDTLAQSFEQTLRDAGSMADEHLHDIDLGYSEVNPVRHQTRRTEPVRTITTDEGDRAELWSSGQDSQAAAGVLRRRLASMRREPGA